MNENVNIIIKARDEAARKFRQVSHAGTAMAQQLSSAGNVVKTAFGGAVLYFSIEKTIRLTRQLMDAYKDSPFKATAAAINRVKESFNSLKLKMLETLAGPVERFSSWTVTFVDRFRTMAGTLIDLFTFIRTAFADSLKLMAWEGTYWITKWALDTAYWFTIKIPAYLTYLKEQWANIFLTIYDGTKAIFANLWLNIQGFFENVWNWMNGDATDWRWTGLLKGFQSTVDEMKPIAERLATSFEQQLAADISAAKGRITANFGAIVGTANAPAAAAGTVAPGRQTIAAQEARFLGTVAGGSTPADKTASNTARMANSTDKIVRVLEQTQKLLERLGGQSVLNPPMQTVSIIK